MKLFTGVFTLLCFFKLTDCTNSKFLITINEENLNNHMLDSKINFIENFKVGDFSGFIIDTEYTKEDLESFNYIKNVEEDQIFKLEHDIFKSDIIEETDDSTNYQWGLDRIDQQSLPLDENNFTVANTGKDVYIYIVDTGLRTSHKEFNNIKNRTIKGWDFAYNDPDPNDEYGHGTHVASIAAGSSIGVAKEATLVGVKVLDDNGSGFYSNIIKGIEWSVNHSKKNNVCGIISMSLGGSKSDLLNNVIDSAVNSGINVVVSAGNKNIDSCSRSPASAKKAITVGSTNIEDTKSYFSNHGSCVDIFAPGSNIYGAWVHSDSSYRTISGTSMSCPHVTGALAVYLQHNGCESSITKFINTSINNKLSNIPNNTVNKLLQVLKNNKPITMYPTSSPTFLCPPSKAILYCHMTRNDRERNKKSCKSSKWKKLCTWCGDEKKCQVEGSCSDQNKYKKCITLYPTNSPTLSPVPVPTNFPTNSPTLSPVHVPTNFPTSRPTIENPKFIELKWRSLNSGLIFNLNGRIGKITITNIYITYNRKSSDHIWKNDIVKKNDIVVMTIGGYFRGSNGIPNIIVRSVEDGIVKFVLANSDGNNKLSNVDLDINFLIF